ncbi:hypothetical protein C8R45DRAFT_1204570 [Mycena sanguinolenta]|nr:hypothetical protein C8R45DRAFT_1204570 [Mycena sanguinolenta]
MKFSAALALTALTLAPSAFAQSDTTVFTSLPTLGPPRPSHSISNPLSIFSPSFSLSLTATSSESASLSSVTAPPSSSSGVSSLGVSSSGVSTPVVSLSTSNSGLSASGSLTSSGSAPSNSTNPPNAARPLSAAGQVFAVTLSAGLLAAVLI